MAIILKDVEEESLELPGTPLNNVTLRLALSPTLCFLNVYTIFTGQPAYNLLGLGANVLRESLTIFSLLKPTEQKYSPWLASPSVVTHALTASVYGNMRLLPQLARLLTRPICFGVKHISTLFLLLKTLPNPVNILPRTTASLSLVRLLVVRRNGLPLRQPYHIQRGTSRNTSRVIRNTFSFLRNTPIHSTPQNYELSLALEGYPYCS